MKNILFILILMFFKSSDCLSQNIYILGDIKEGDRNNIQQLVDAINGKFKPREIPIYHLLTDDPFNSKDDIIYIYKCHKKNQEENLEEALIDQTTDVSSYIKLTNKVIGDKKKEVKKIKPDYSLFIYQKNSIPTGKLFNDFQKLFDEIEKKEKKSDQKINFLLIFTKDPPTIYINSHKSNQTTTSNKIEGGSKSAVAISSVSVRINSGEWQKAIGTNIWSFSSAPFKEGVNLIEARVIDQLNDTSIIESINFTYKNKVTTNLIKYTSPDREQNRVEKSRTNDNLPAFTFKFSMDNSLDIADVRLILKDQEGKQKFTIKLSDIPHGVEVNPIPGTDLYSVCFYLLVDEFHSPDGSEFLWVNACSVDDELLYSYEYKLNTKVKYSTQILVEFTSFSQHDEKIDEYSCW